MGGRVGSQTRRVGGQPDSAGIVTVRRQTEPVTRPAQLTADELARRYGIDERSAGVLAEFGFDANVFDELRAQLGDPSSGPNRPTSGPTSQPTGKSSTALNHLRASSLRACEPSDLVPLAEPGCAEHAELVELGGAALAAGQVGCLVLAGGMATRFGGGTKALATVSGDATFIDYKVADVALAARNFGGTVPLWLMTSFATHAPLNAWAAGGQPDRAAGGQPDKAASTHATRSIDIECVPQFASMRLRPDGELVCVNEADPPSRAGQPKPCTPSLYAPGHGDVPWAMARSGTLERFRASGGRYVLLSNVDNLGATVDPSVIGAHIANGNPLTCEVARGSDVGGAPWWVDGRLQIVEAFRLPPERDPTEAGCVNTNTMVIDVDVLAAASPLTFFRVHKQVDGETVVQFERLIGELSAHVATTMLVVPRDGPAGRFFPVKDPSELARRRRDITATLAAKGIVSERVAPSS